MKFIVEHHDIKIEITIPEDSTIDSVIDSVVTLITGMGFSKDVLDNALFEYVQNLEYGEKEENNNNRSREEWNYSFDETSD